MNTDFDLQLLDSELDAIEGLDMGEFGFEVEEPGIPQPGQGAEIDVDDFSEDKFEHECPRCGFRFNG